MLRQNDDFEEQVRAAKERTAKFSRSVVEARQQESEALKLLEQERRAWTASFEEQNVLIEQLERELASTVDALTQSSGAGAGAVHEVSASVQLDRQVPRYSKSVDTSTDSYAPNNIHPNLIMVHCKNNDNYEGPAQKNLQDTWRVTEPPHSPSVARSYPILAERNSLHSAAAEHVALDAENRRLSVLVRDLEETIEKIKNAWRESDTKLSFRTSQVVNYLALFLNQCTSTHAHVPGSRARTGHSGSRIDTCHFRRPDQGLRPQNRTVVLGLC